MSRVRKGIDTQRLSKAVSQPGIDPRVWATKAVVMEVGFDVEEGIFADVRYIPTGEEETVFVGSNYVGDNFGEWEPLTVGDVVLVVVPRGDPSEGPVLVTRLWGRRYLPPSKMGNGEDTSDDRILVVKPGQKYHVIVSDGGEVFLENDSASITIKGGEIDITAASVKIGDDSAAAVVHFLEFMQILQAWLLEINTDITTNLALPTFAAYAAAKTGSLTALQTALTLIQAPPFNLGTKKGTMT